jgi:hypothetical protein
MIPDKGMRIFHMGFNVHLTLTEALPNGHWKAKDDFGNDCTVSSAFFSEERTLKRTASPAGIVVRTGRYGSFSFESDPAGEVVSISIRGEGGNANVTHTLDMSRARARELFIRLGNELDIPQFSTFVGG